MSPSETGEASVRVRREPPPFRQVVVRRVESLSPRMIRVTFTGPDLEGFTVDKPASSVRLLLPSLGEQTLVVPAWQGNEFLLSDGQRPTIRTFTPRRVDPVALELDLDIVVHDGGAASEWVVAAAPGHRAAVSGPGRGYSIDSNASGFLLAGDETAIPAISQLLEALPDRTPVDVIIEVARKDARLTLPDHRDATVKWCDLPPGVAPGSALITAVRGARLEQGIRVWGAGEAAAMHQLRRYLFEDRGLARTEATVRGYWKHGRGGEDNGE